MQGGLLTAPPASYQRVSAAVPWMQELLPGAVTRLLAALHEDGHERIVPVVTLCIGVPMLRPSIEFIRSLLQLPVPDGMDCR